MALRVPGCRPEGYRSGMPMVLPQAIAEEFGAGYLVPEERTDPPLSSAIDEMDRSMGWILLYLPGQTQAAIRHRRVMLSRCLISPRNDRHVASYRAIADRLGISHTYAQTLWENGLERIAAGLNRNPPVMPVSCSRTLGRVRSMQQVTELARGLVAQDIE